MLDYTGVKCPVCEKPFGEDDDVVVCPVCGAPYHRHCYEQKGSCIFEDLHAEGKEWKPPAQPAPEPGGAAEASARVKDVECWKCGTLNDRSARYCSRCGAMLPHGARPDGEPAQNHAKTYGGTYPGGAAGGFPGPFSPLPITFDPMGGVNPTTPMGVGVTYGEASKVVRVRTDYYMPVFRYIQHTGRNKFNFSAFLFSGAWLLYRKQYKSGVIVSALMVLLQIAYQCALWLLADPTLNLLAAQAGIDLAGGAATNQQILALSNLAAQDLGIYLKIMSPVLVLLAMLAVMVVIGVRGNKMYLRHCVGAVQEVKAAGTDGDPAMTYSAKGGINAMAALCVGLCFSILHTFLPLLFL